MCVCVCMYVCVCVYMCVCICQLCVCMGMLSVCVWCVCVCVCVYVIGENSPSSYLRTPELHISIFIRQTTIAIGLTHKTRLKVKQHTSELQSHLNLVCRLLLG